MGLADISLNHLTDAERREAEGLLSKYAALIEAGAICEDRDEMIALVQLASFGLDWLVWLRTTEEKKQAKATHG